MNQGIMYRGNEYQGMHGAMGPDAMKQAAMILFYLVVFCGTGG